MSRRKRQHDHLPCGAEMIMAAVAFGAGRAEYSSDEMLGALATHYNLTAEDLALLLGNGRNAFRNYVDHLLRAMTLKGIHRPVRDQNYQPAAPMADMAAALARGEEHEARSIFLRSTREQDAPRRARDCGGRMDRGSGKRMRWNRSSSGSRIVLSSSAEPRAKRRRVRARPRVVGTDGTLPQPVQGVLDIADFHEEAPVPPSPAPHASGPEPAPGIISLPLRGGEATLPSVDRDIMVLPAPADLESRPSTGEGSEVAMDAQTSATEAVHPVRGGVSIPDLKDLVSLAHDISILRNLTPSMLLTLREKGVDSIPLLADTTPESMKRMLSDQQIDFKTAYGIVMAARAFWFGSRGRAYDGIGLPRAAP